MFKSMVSRLDVRSCVARKNFEGELRFEQEGDDSLVDIPYVGFSSPVRYVLRYEIAPDDTVLIRGTLAFSLKGACSRCLAETEREFSEELFAVFTPGEPKGDEYAYRGGVVDFTEFLRDSLLFALPMRLLCDPCDREE